MSKEPVCDLFVAYWDCVILGHKCYIEGWGGHVEGKFGPDEGPAHHLYRYLERKKKEVVLWSKIPTFSAFWDVYQLFRASRTP